MRKIYLLILCLLLLVVFVPWFNSAPLAGGDWHYFFYSSLSGYTPGIWTWDFSYLNGLGGNDIFLLGLNSYFLNGSYLLMHVISLPWWVVERVMWYWPFLILSCISSYFLFKTYYSKNTFGIMTVALFLNNTYSLMLFGGGQVGVAMAFSLAPLLLGLFAQIMSASQTKKSFSETTFLSLLTGVILSIQIFLDLRVVYVLLVAFVLFFLFSFSQMLSLKKMFYLIITFLIAILLNIFWILPQGLIHQNPLQERGNVYTTAGAVTYFSFAKLEDALGLLHPNWPENIFGKVGFMKPEFLLLPILAFSSLLFINKKTKNDEEKKEKLHVVYFALLGLVGIFLAKGANDPFGGIYLWMFGHVPGFIMFRDPTKWYLLIVLSYSMLIPYTVSKIYDVFKRRFA